MVSFCCAVIRRNLKDYLDILTDSLCRHTKLVKEVIFVQTDEPEGLLRSWSSKGIDFRLYGCAPIDTPLGPEWEQMICGHARGLHKAIDLAQQEYVWLSDPDIFLLSSVDQTYLDLIQKYELNLIGVSHFNALGQAYQYCPCIINCMMKKADLPPPGWLGGFHAQSAMRVGDSQNVCPVGDNWLIPGPLTEHQDSFPDPKGIFDAGCNVWLWNAQRKGRWLSFQLDPKDLQASFSYYLTGFNRNTGFPELVYPMNYKLCNYRSNFDLQDNLGDTELLYHRTRGCREKSKSYRDLYWSLYQPCP